MKSTSKSVVYTDRAPKPPPFLAQGIVTGNTVFCSGQIGVDPDTGALVKGTVKDRLRQIVSNLESVLKAAGSSLQNVVKVNVFLTDMADYAAMNEAYAALFPDPKAARTCVCVQSLPLGTDIEVECVAVIDSPVKTRL
ncbi:hypothetical protein VTN77DRAFT_5695 [Rasamsonia byssochlamydoides]|uniref:uncharacterized protein n=1 Tax=Rasamsonia byssochlamydoides TaxID=89139 RepID=UPI0037447794